MYLNTTYYGGCVFSHLDRETLNSLESVMARDYHQFDFVTSHYFLDLLLVNQTKEKGNYRCKAADVRRFSMRDEAWLKQNELMNYPAHGFFTDYFYFKGKFNHGIIESKQFKYKVSFKITPTQVLNLHLRMVFFVTLNLEAL